jgi:hypothetical protein
MQKVELHNLYDTPNIGEISSSHGGEYEDD